MIHTADGRSVRPADYLAAFEQYVRENPDHVEAIRILLERPQEWGTNALQELRAKLAARPEGFTDQRLRQAYQTKVRAGKSFTPEQECWLALIRSHLVENLAIDRTDFLLISFTRAGATWARVDREFDGQLESLLAEINAAMAV